MVSTALGTAGYAPLREPSLAPIPGQSRSHGRRRARDRAGGGRGAGAGAGGEGPAGHRRGARPVGAGSAAAAVERRRAGDRPARPRRPGPRRGGSGDLAVDRVDRDADRAPVRPVDRAHRGLRGRGDRQRADAAGRSRAGVPVPPARDPSGRAGSRDPARHLERAGVPHARGRRVDDDGARDPRQDPGARAERDDPGRARDRREPGPDRGAPHPAERRRRGDRRDRARLRPEPARRGGAVVPRPGAAAAGADLGPHAVRGPRVLPDRAPPRALAEQPQVRIEVQHAQLPIVLLCQDVRDAADVRMAR